MSDDPQEQETTQIPVDAPAPDAGDRVDIVAPEPVEAAYEPPAYTPPSSDAGSAGVVEEKPELVVAGAFAGAFIFAKLLQRIGGNR